MARQTVSFRRGSTSRQAVISQLGGLAAITLGALVWSASMVTSAHSLLLPTLSATAASNDGQFHLSPHRHLARANELVRQQQQQAKAQLASTIARQLITANANKLGQGQKELELIMNPNEVIQLDEEPHELPQQRPAQEYTLREQMDEDDLDSLSKRSDWNSFQGNKIIDCAQCGCSPQKCLP